jgi:hypothetical protein
MILPNRWFRRRITLVECYVAPYTETIKNIVNKCAFRDKELKTRWQPVEVQKIKYLL